MDKASLDIVNVSIIVRIYSRPRIRFQVVMVGLKELEEQFKQLFRRRVEDTSVKLLLFVLQYFIQFLCNYIMLLAKIQNMTTPKRSRMFVFQIQGIHNSRAHSLEEVGNALIQRSRF